MDVLGLEFNIKKSSDVIRPTGRVVQNIQSGPNPFVRLEQEMKEHSSPKVEGVQTARTTTVMPEPGGLLTSRSQILKQSQKQMRTLQKGIQRTSLSLKKGKTYGSSTAIIGPTGSNQKKAIRGRGKGGGTMSKSRL